MTFGLTRWFSGVAHRNTSHRPHDPAVRSWPLGQAEDEMRLSGILQTRARHRPDRQRALSLHPCVTPAPVQGAPGAPLVCAGLCLLVEHSLTAQ